MWADIAFEEIILVGCKEDELIIRDDEEGAIGVIGRYGYVRTRNRRGVITEFSCGITDVGCKSLRQTQPNILKRGNTQEGG